MASITSKEVQELLRRVGDGEVVPIKVTPGTWFEVYCGNMEFLVDGWKVVIFNDCDEFDYVDSVVSPDGRVGPHDEWGEWTDQPTERLQADDNECYERMVRVFESL